jgi:acyl-CoA dehydrogenase
VRRFIDAEVAPRYEDWERAGCVPRETWLRAGSEGWLCPTASPEHGGAGADFLYSLVINEELSRSACPGFFVPLHNDIVFPYLDGLGTPEQKRRFVPGSVSGRVILALAMTEPSAGSDLAAIRARATRQGGDYVLSGSKTFISNGQLADLFIVAAKTDPDARPPHRGISLFLVESDRPGFTRGRNLAKIGLHAQDTSEIFFENCRVPSSNLLGTEGMGFRHMMENLQQERLTLAAGGAAAAEGALALTLEYVKSREAFGAPLAKLQHVRFELAEIATEVRLGRTFIDALVARHLRGEKLPGDVSMAKAWVTDMQFRVADRCLQLFGGYGYMREYPISRFFVDARVQRIYGGSNEIMKEIVARDLGL